MTLLEGLMMFKTAFPQVGCFYFPLPLAGFVTYKYLSIPSLQELENAGSSCSHSSGNLELEESTLIRAEIG